MKLRCQQLMLLTVVLTMTAAIAAHPGSGLVVADDGTIYCVYGPGNRIWKLSPGGEPHVFVQGGFDQDFRVPHHLVLDDDGSLVTASDAGSFVWRITPQGEKTRLYPPDEWNGQATVGFGGDPFTIDAHGNIIAVLLQRDPPQSRIVRIARNGDAETIAGGPRGFADGEGETARFGHLHGASFAWGPDGWLYLTDDGTRVRRISAQGKVETIAELNQTEDTNPYLAGLTVAPDRTIYVAAMNGRRIYKVASDGKTSILAGTGERGGTDGPCDKATFDQPVGVALDPSGRIVVLECARVDHSEIVRLRRIDPANGTAETIAVIDEP